MSELDLCAWYACMKVLRLDANVLRAAFFSQGSYFLRRGLILIVLSFNLLDLLSTKNIV